MGNRGCLHDDQGNIRRAYQGKRWIICLLNFKNRRRIMMTPGQYTELFFLDEATALAAGHRPCAECQRERFTLFREQWAAANPHLVNTPKPAATVIDDHLHRERLQQVRETAPVAALPDGSFFTFDGDNQAYLVYQGGLFHWQPTGYTPAPPDLQKRPAQRLTPASIVRTLAVGYPVQLHSSLFTAQSR